MTRPGVRPRSRARAGGDTLTRTYDRAGNVTAEGRTLAGIPGDAGSGTQAFTYDGLGRLVGSSGLAVAKSYGYDLDGDRVRKTEGAVTTTYTYDRTDALVSQVHYGAAPTSTGFGGYTPPSRRVRPPTASTSDTDVRIGRSAGQATTWPSGCTVATWNVTVIAASP